MDRWVAAADIAVGLLMLVCASLIVAPPAMRVLLASVGIVWLLETSVPALVGLHRTALVLCFLAFPSGRLTGRVRWVLAIAAIGLAPGITPQVGDAAFFLVISVVLFAMADRELIRAAALAALLVGLSMAFSWGMRQFDPASFDPRQHLLVYQGVILGTGVVLCAATRFRPWRSRWFADDLLGADTSGGLTGLAALLRATLRDPDIEIVPVGADTSARKNLVRVEVREGHAVVAELRHRRGSIPDERALRSVVEAVRLAVAQSQRTSELQLQSLELAAAENRLALAAERRRADISARLNDEVLTRIDEAAVAVGSASIRSTAPDAVNALTIVREELRATKHDVRLIVEHGRLGEGDLPAALRSLATLSESVTVEADPAAVADADTETALYYVAAEAVTNALKHAEALRIVVTLTREGDELVLTVTDDGRGGAEPTMAGLAGLRNRVEAAAGGLEMTSPGGVGTTITARVPVRRSSTRPR